MLSEDPIGYKDYGKTYGPNKSSFSYLRFEKIFLSEVPGYCTSIVFEVLFMYQFMYMYQFETKTCDKYSSV